MREFSLIMDVKFQEIATNGVILHTALAGPENGEPVVLLHGFPDFWMAWRKQIEPLAKAGFRVIVPDQRGYNLSSKPLGARNYKVEILANDIIGLAKALGYDRFNLAGHDWGAAVSWAVALNHPLNIKKLAILNAPHPAVFHDFIRKNPGQMMRSWYMAFFQLPLFPELSIKRQMSKLANYVIPGLSEEEKDMYYSAWRQKGALTGMVNWYRALRYHTPQFENAPNVVVPTLILWGEKDKYLRYELAQKSCDKCDIGKLVLFDNASHWVMVDEAQRVNELMIEFFS